MNHPPDWNRIFPKNPALLLLDFDGVMTDNSVWVDQNGTESVRCSRGDGMGVSLLRKAGFPVMILSTERNPVVHRRAEKLKIPCVAGVEDKTAAFHEILKDRGVSPADVIFVGNDINDLGCLRAAGCALVVADAHPSVIPFAHAVLQHNGGRGAVREVCDALLAHLGLSPYYNESDRPTR